jgi:hypothetical protein
MHISSGYIWKYLTVTENVLLSVNFQKYQRSYDHLKSSSVYRMIHETEKSRPGAFEGRPEKILALQDYKQALQASSCKMEEVCSTDSLYVYNNDDNW